MKSAGIAVGFAALLFSIPGKNNKIVNHLQVGTTCSGSFWYWRDNRCAVQTDCSKHDSSVYKFIVDNFHHRLFNFNDYACIFVSSKERPGFIGSM